MSRPLRQRPEFFFPHPLRPRRQLPHPFLLQSPLRLLPPHALRLRQLHPRPLIPRHPRPCRPRRQLPHPFLLQSPLRLLPPHPLRPRRQLPHPFLLQSPLRLLPPHALRLRQLHPRPLIPRHPRLTLYNYAGPYPGVALVRSSDSSLPTRMLAQDSAQAIRFFTRRSECANLRLCGFWWTQAQT